MSRLAQGLGRGSAPSEDSLSVELGRPVVDADDAFARGIAYETIRQHLFGHREVLQIGRYRLEKEIGRGGMGEVFEAYDPELDRRVAIKRVGRRSSDDDDEAARLADALMRDARSGARVQHPHVVEIYDCGLEDQELYVVMELVEGPTLEQWLGERTRSWREIVEVFVQAGEGLASVHAHGLVHRDFKPDNVLIGADGRARVADFGLARSTGDLRVTRPDDPAASVVESMGVAGTPQYMAPEQYVGAGVSPRADQFAYCNALYRALFGEPPFDGHKLEELASNVVQGHVRPPTNRRGAPRGLVGLVLRGLAVRPEDRHHSMDALVERLRSVLLRRRRAAWALGAAGLAVCTAAAGYWWPRVQLDSPCAAVQDPWTTHERQRVHEALLRRPSFEHHSVAHTMGTLDEYAAGWVLARQDACEATMVRGEQSDEVMDLRVACLDRLRVPFSAVSSRLAAAKGPSGMGALGLVRELVPVSSCSAARVREQAQMALAFRSETDRSGSPESESQWRALSARLTHARAEAAVERLQRAHDEARHVAELARPQGFRYLLADALLLQGVYGLRLARTTEQLDRAREILESAAPLAVESGSTRLAAVVFLELAVAASPWRSPDIVRHWLDLANAHTVVSPAGEDLLGRIETARGDLAMRTGGLDEAMLHYRRALELGGEPPGAARAALGLAEAQRQRGDFRQARQTLGTLREQLERSRWSDPAVLAAAVHNLALVALDEQALDEALELGRTAQRLYERSAARHGVELQQARTTVARVLRLGGELAAAREILLDVVEDLEPRGVAAWPSSTRALDELVETALGLGEPERALGAAERLLEVATALHPDEAAEVALARMMLARAALAAGAVERALSESSRAHMALRDAPPGLLQAEAAFRYAEAALATGDLDTAARLSHQASQMLAELPGSELAQQEVRRWVEERGLDGERRTRE